MRAPAYPPVGLQRRMKGPATTVPPPPVEARPRPPSRPKNPPDSAGLPRPVAWFRRPLGGTLGEWSPGEVWGGELQWSSSADPLRVRPKSNALGNSKHFQSVLGDSAMAFVISSLRLRVAEALQTMASRRTSPWAAGKRADLGADRQRRRPLTQLFARAANRNRQASQVRASAGR